MSNSPELVMSQGSTSERAPSRGRLACVPCRQRKTRCPGPVDDDHIKPCARCSRLSIDCFWRERKLPPNPKRSHSESSPGEISPMAKKQKETPRDNSASPEIDALQLDVNELESLIVLYFETAHHFAFLNFIHPNSFKRLLRLDKAPRRLTAAMVACALRYGGDPSPTNLNRSDQLCEQIVQSLRFTSLASFGVVDLMTTVIIRMVEGARGSRTSCFLLWGQAVRMLQYLSLQTFDQTYASSELPDNPFLKPESLRRLAWSVLYQDTMSDAGIFGDHLIVEEAYTIQLPTDEINFEAGIEVQTALLDTPRLDITPLSDPGNKDDSTAPGKSLLACLLRTALARRRVHHFNSRILGSPKSVDELMDHLGVVEDVMRNAIVNLPSDLAYTKYNLVRHRSIRIQFMLLHLLRHNCFLMLSLARINIADKFGEDESILIKTRQDRVRHALAVSQIVAEMLSEGIPGDLFVSVQAYSCVEILLFDPLKLSRAGLPTRPKDELFVTALTHLMTLIRRETPTDQYIAFLRVEACHRFIRCGFANMVQDSDREILANLEYTTSSFAIPPGDRLHTDEVDEELNFRHIRWRFPENRAITSVANRSWLLARGDIRRDTVPQAPTDDTMLENDASVVGQHSFDQTPLPAITHDAAALLGQSSLMPLGLTNGFSSTTPSMSAGVQETLGADDLAFLFGQPDPSPVEGLSDYQWMLNM